MPTATSSAAGWLLCDSEDRALRISGETEARLKVGAGPAWRECLPGRWPGRVPGQEAGTSVNRSSVPATTSGLGERRRLPARFPADVGPDNGPLCPAWAGCQGARPWPGALAPASTRARGPENPADKEARPLPETITAKEIRAQSRCARPPGPHSARASEAGQQPVMPASRSRGWRVPTLQPGACTALLLKPTLRGSAEPGAAPLTAPTSPSQRDRKSVV